MTTKEERLTIINQLIKEIASRGNRAFYSKENKITSHFVFQGDKQKRLWYFGENGAKINPYPSHYHNDYHFNGGGTLWSLIHDFSEFILTGEDTNGKYGYGGLTCHHERWGYPESDMTAIQKLAYELGYLTRN